MQGNTVFVLFAVKIRINNSLLFDLNFVSKNTVDLVNRSGFHEGVHKAYVYIPKVFKTESVVVFLKSNEKPHFFRQLVSVSSFCYSPSKNSISVYSNHQA